MGEVNPSVTVPPKKMKIVFISGRFLLTLVMLFYQFFAYLKANLESLAREQLHPSGVNLSVIYVLHPTVTGELRDGIGSLNLAKHLEGWNQLILSATT